VRGAFVAAALVVVVAAAALLFWRVEDVDEPAPRGARPAGPELPPAESFAARVKRGMRVALWDRPNGTVVRRIDDTTEFGSPEVLSPTGPRRGAWIAVRHTSLGNRGVAWVRARPAALTLRPRRVRLDVDLSRRELVVVTDGGRPRRFSIAIGAPETPTPPGEFFVTDKLRGADFGAFYGCCILALSGRQPNLPRGWSGGDRLAIHGSPTSTWGLSVSNGCLHARTADLRYLMRTVPLGAAVTVHA
jgi:lipoprotein-anchoring transpeptidase ErfK/SrfK